jgi:hypothetical protein
LTLLVEREDQISIDGCGAVSFRDNPEVFKRDHFPCQPLFFLSNCAAQRSIPRLRSSTESRAPAPDNDRAAHCKPEAQTDCDSCKTGTGSGSDPWPQSHKEQTVSKSLAEKARLEAELENSRFALVAEKSGSCPRSTMNASAISPGGAHYH